MGGLCCHDSDSKSGSTSTTVSTASSGTTAVHGTTPSRISTTTAGQSATTNSRSDSKSHDSSSVIVVIADSGSTYTTASQEKIPVAGQSGKASAADLQAVNSKKYKADLSNSVSDSSEEEYETANGGEDEEKPLSYTANVQVQGVAPSSISSTISQKELSQGDIAVSSESEVLRFYSNELVTAMKAADPLRLAIKLYAKGLIEEESRDRVSLLVHTRQEKAHIIVSAVQRRVEADSSLFHQFTALLQDEGDDILRSFSRKLQEECRSTLPSHRSPLYQPLPSRPQSQLCLYANKLRTIYTQSEFPIYANPACYKWTPSPSKKYIDLTTIDKKEKTTQDKIQYKGLAVLTGKITEKGSVDTIKFEEILQVKPDEKLKCVLIDGTPGIGKSTLAWQVCHRWGKRELFQQYSTVLLLPLRDQRVQGAKCVEDLFISTDTKFQERVRREVTLKNWDGDDSLIILEGLDELPNHLLSQPSIFTGLLSGTELPRATILITSRPTAAIEQLLKHQKRRISRHLEIRGFTAKGISEYVQSVLSNYEQFKKYLSNYPRIQSMMYVPLHCVIAVTVYLQCQQSHTHPPKTLTGLYTCLTQTILIQYLNDHPQYTTGGSLTLYTLFDIHIPYPVHNYFKELCRIAYEHLIDQKLIFSDIPRELHDLGFTDAVPEFLLYQQSANYSYNFLHLSVQEFLAAYHVSLMSSSEQEELLATRYFQSHFMNMFRFVAGITKFEGLYKVLRKTVSSSCQRFITLFNIPYNIGISEHILGDDELELLYESQNMSVLDAECTCRCAIKGNSEHSYFALGYCIANSSCGWNVEISNSSTSTQAEMIHQGLKESKTCHTSCNIKSIGFRRCKTEFIDKLFGQNAPEKLKDIESLTLQHNLPQLIPRMKKLNTLSTITRKDDNIIWTDTYNTELIAALSKIPTLRNLALDRLNSESITFLCQCLPAWQLETLQLPSLSSDHVEMVSRALTDSLKTLNLKKSEFTIQSMQAFACNLHHNQSLTEVNISSCSIDSDIACCLAEALHHNTALRKLYVYKNPVGERGALAMAEMFEHNTTLEDLNLRKTNIGSDGAAAIAKALHHNTTLRNLEISENSVGNRGALAMTEMLKHNTTLEELDLNNADIDSDGAVAMAKGIHDNITLTKLDISGNPVGEKGAIEMAEMLKYNTTLEELVLHLADIGSDGAVALAEALHHNTTLRLIGISLNSVGMVGALAMAEMLKQNNTLEELNMDHSVDDEGIKIVVKSLAVNQNLKKLTFFSLDESLALEVYHDHKERVEMCIIL